MPAPFISILQMSTAHRLNYQPSKKSNNNIFSIPGEMVRQPRHRHASVRFRIGGQRGRNQISLRLFDIWERIFVTVAGGRRVRVSPANSDGQGGRSAQPQLSRLFARPSRLHRHYPRSCRRVVVFSVRLFVSIFFV